MAYGTQGFVTTDVNYVDVSDYGSIGAVGTIDAAFIVPTLSSGSGTIQVIGSAAGGTPSPLRITLTNDLMTVEFNAAGTATFVYPSMVNQEIYVRVAWDLNKIVCYVCAFDEQIDTAATGTVNNTYPFRLGADYSNPSAQVNWGWFRIFRRPIFNRGGIADLYPRPRDKDVMLSLVCDQGHPTVTDGTTTFIADESSFQRHAPLVSTYTSAGGMQRVLFTQVAADNNGKFPLIVDGDLFLGELK
jgi:hypothetical protein